MKYDYKEAAVVASELMSEELIELSKTPPWALIATKYTYSSYIEVVLGNYRLVQDSIYTLGCTALEEVYIVLLCRPAGLFGAWSAVSVWRGSLNDAPLTWELYKAKLITLYLEAKERGDQVVG